jgi:Flp pilus assembly protein TadD
MSLLMDALKKAELAKRQGQSEGASGSIELEAPGGLALEPIPDSALSQDTAAPATPSAPSFSHMSAHLEELDEQFLAEAKQAASARLKTQATPPSEPITVQPAPAEAAKKPPLEDVPPRPPIAPESRRQQADKPVPQDKSAAQNLFAAKQVEKPPARKAFAIAIGVVTVLSVSGIGGYFWWQLQPKSNLAASRMPPPSSAPVAVPATPSQASAPSVPPSAAPGSAVPTAAGKAGPVADGKTDVMPPVAAKAPAQAVRANPIAAAPIDPDSPVRVTRNPLQVNPALMRGFDAFNRGELALAQVEYERAQKSDPRNTDAMHGLAAIAVRQGRHEQAELLYRRITEADPQDTVAMSALINSRGQIDPGAAESRLKSLSATQPELAAPQFSLGNLYARHGRWSEAQQAYFRAYSAEPDNPDILYNLAISLEHLRQNKLAAQYYGQAIAAAQIRPAGFDKAQATARLQALQP